MPILVHKNHYTILLLLRTETCIPHIALMSSSHLPYTIPWKHEEFQISIACASFSVLHEAILLLNHNEPFQVSLFIIHCLQNSFRNSDKILSRNLYGHNITNNYY